MNLLAAKLSERAACGSCVIVPLLTAVLFMPANALAYEQTMTCSRDADALFPCGDNETPLPVCWSERTITYHLNANGSDDLRTQDGALPFEFEDAIQSSFSAWAAPDCAHITLEYGGRTEDDRVGYFRDGEDTNLIIWQEDWPYADTSAYALTSVTFNASTGTISDVDIELNGEHFTWSLKELPRVNEVDLQNTLTHEVGHFIGFDHSPLPSATMYASAPQGETSKRTLSQDDIDAVCEVYTPVEDDGGGCGRCTTSSTPERRSTPALALLGLLSFALFRRRRAS